jgi:hypothetical protein
MKRISHILLLATLLALPILNFSQATEGKVIYKYTIFYDEIYAKVDFLSQSEKD